MVQFCFINVAGEIAVAGSDAIQQQAASIVSELYSLDQPRNDESGKCTIIHLICTRSILTPLVDVYGSRGVHDL